MSQRGTLQPTAERIRSFRARGDIARSRDAVAAAALTGAVLGLLATGAQTWGALTGLVEQACLHPEAEAAAGLDRRGLDVAILAVVPPLAGACAGALAAIALQLGWPPVLWPRRRARRSQPGGRAMFTHLRGAFGLAAMARRTVATFAKLAVLALILALTLEPASTLVLATPAQLLAALVAGGRAALVDAAAGLLALGLLDYAWARRRLLGRMKMTHDDVRRELRELEGDPSIKARRARRRQELSRRLAAGALDGAELLLLAPDEAAIALRYRPGDAAPIMVRRAHATSAEVLALTTLARDQGLPIFERPALARALAAHDERQLSPASPASPAIPPMLYRAVAEVFALARAGASP